MSILSSDWTYEHLIRTKRIPSPIPKAEKAGVEEAREHDRQVIERLSKILPQVEIAKRTGLSRNRVFQICRYFGITCDKGRQGQRRKEGGRL